MRRLIFVTGAGLSVDSGIRAFRTDTASGKSMWDEFEIGEVCHLRAFQRGFRVYTGEQGVFEGTDDEGVDLYTKTHNFYNMRRQELATVEPNIAHLRIAEWFKRYPDVVLNVTTNVDDLLERAGIPQREIIHVHGYLKEIKYRRNGQMVVENVGYKPIAIEKYDWVKPNVVFFEEGAPEYALMHATFDSLTANDMVIVVGCSNQVIQFNWELFPAMNQGTKMMVVNPMINYFEEQEYEKRGVTVWRAGAAEVFGNKHFIGQVEAFMEGRVYVAE